MPVSDPATTALRALVKPDSRGSRLSTNMSPSSARFDDDDALAPSSYEPSRAGAQKATRQPHYGLTGSSGNSLDADHDDDRRSNAVAARKHEKRSKDLESRLDEDEDEFDYLNPNENSGRREEKGQSDGEDEDSNDQLPDHPPRYRV
ncbi:hypothetical protein M407DRAFT_241818 [Tulasnella calospora MUT 4182]|uniref:Uncharacterized protein n=1 Tax=Tulasnella calospora MUT 4182 TaxID=1051891 RepID=A0A0C3QHT8_9AGAM|nr:hypothetical protein M407DRAFT_241818 [Tulasnella calospora MUT 4182]